MDRETKNKILIRYVKTLEDKHGSVGAAEESGDKEYKEMRKFVKRYFEQDINKSKKRRRAPSHQWTDEEVDYLKANYANTLTKVIAKNLDIPIGQVNNKARTLGLYKPKVNTDYNKQFIIKNHKTMTRKQMAESLGLTYSGINYCLRALKEEGIDLQPLSNRESGWTKKEEEYLSKHYPTTRTSEVAKALGRSESSVRSKAQIMGVKRIFNQQEAQQ